MVYQHRNFASVLDDIAWFLQHNRSETVLIRVKEEHSAQGNTRTFEETVNAHFAKYGRYFRTDAHWDMPLRDLRGKIVMLKEFNGATPFGNIYYSGLIRQDDFHLGSNWDLYGKWSKVKQMIDVANANGPSLAPFLNFLSGSGGAFPYFVASGHSDPRTTAGGLTTGLTTPRYQDWFPDFPRGACFMGICTIYYEGTNTLTKNYLRNKKIKYAGIIAADFPGPGLIQSVIDVNRTDRPVVNAGNGRCLDTEGGVHAGSALLSWPCHGGVNQRLTMLGEQIRVGGLCLDVEGGHNAPGARVIAWPCHGGANQNWTFTADGQIRTLMQGARRCIGVNFANNRTGLVDCVAGRSDQTFRTRVN
jgi:1-phosphatidylinositol phosphodiesterase